MSWKLVPSPSVLLILLSVSTTTVTSLNYKCHNDQVLVVQSFGNDTIRMHCQRLDMCGYQKLKCDYDEMQPQCGGQLNFVSHVNQKASTSPVEHTCCNLYNPRAPHVISTHTGNDCFIYELPDGTANGKPVDSAPSDAPYAVLKNAAEIPQQFDGYSGYRLRLFLLKNKSPPTLLVKGIERRLDGYRVTICRPRCSAYTTVNEGDKTNTDTSSSDGNEWRAISWSSWSSSSWSTWARHAFNKANGADGRVRSRTGSAEALQGVTNKEVDAKDRVPANNINIKVESNGNNNNQIGADGKSSGSSVTAGPDDTTAASSAAAASNGSGGNTPGTINVHIHTGNNGTAPPVAIANASVTINGNNGTATSSTSDGKGSSATGENTTGGNGTKGAKDSGSGKKTSGGNGVEIDGDDSDLVAGTGDQSTGRGKGSSNGGRHGSNEGGNGDESIPSRSDKAGTWTDEDDSDTGDNGVDGGNGEEDGNRKKNGAGGSGASASAAGEKKNGGGGAVSGAVGSGEAGGDGKASGAKSKGNGEKGSGKKNGDGASTGSGAGGADTDSEGDGNGKDTSGKSAGDKKGVNGGSKEVSGKGGDSKNSGGDAASGVAGKAKGDKDGNIKVNIKTEGDGEGKKASGSGAGGKSSEGGADSGAAGKADGGDADGKTTGKASGGDADSGAEEKAEGDKNGNIKVNIRTDGDEEGENAAGNGKDQKGSGTIKVNVKTDGDDKKSGVDSGSTIDPRLPQEREVEPETGGDGTDGGDGGNPEVVGTKEMPDGADKTPDGGDDDDVEVTDEEVANNKIGGKPVVRGERPSSETKIDLAIGSVGAVGSETGASDSDALLTGSVATKPLRREATDTSSSDTSSGSSGSSSGSSGSTASDSAGTSAQSDAVASDAAGSSSTGTASRSNCFSADTIVTTVTGTKRMDELNIGDYVLVPAAGNVLKYERVEMFYHREPETRAQFVIIYTKTGRKISMTKRHLLPTADCQVAKRYASTSDGVELAMREARYAEKAAVGECVLSVDQQTGNIVADQIVRIGRKYSRGIYSPMTVEGSLIADGVLASCFSHLESHTVHKAVFDFLMITYNFFGLSNTSPVDVQEIPSVVTLVQQLSSQILPFK